MLLVGGVAHDVRHELDVFVLKVPEVSSEETVQRWAINKVLRLQCSVKNLHWSFTVRKLVVSELLSLGQASVDVVEYVEITLSTVGGERNGS